MSHEKSITIQADGKHWVIPTVVDGMQLPPQLAADMFMKGKVKPLMEPFNSREEADAAAKRRSNDYDPNESVKEQAIDDFLFGGP